MRGLSLRARLRAVASEPILLRAFLSLGERLSELCAWQIYLARWIQVRGARQHIVLKHCEGYQLPLAGRTIRWKAEWPEP